MLISGQEITAVVWVLLIRDLFLMFMWSTNSFTNTALKVGYLLSSLFFALVLMSHYGVIISVGK